MRYFLCICLAISLFACREEENRTPLPSDTFQTVQIVHINKTLANLNEGQKRLLSVNKNRLIDCLVKTETGDTIWIRFLFRNIDEFSAGQVWKVRFSTREAVKAERQQTQEYMDLADTSAVLITGLCNLNTNKVHEVLEARKIQLD